MIMLKCVCVCFSFVTLLKKMDKFKMNFVYDKVFLLIKLALVLPTTIAIVEKIFFFFCDESCEN